MHETGPRELPEIDKRKFAIDLQMQNIHRIRIQEVSSGKDEAPRANIVWGLSQFEGLPVIFEAWRAFPPRQQVSYFANIPGGSLYKTNWSSHVPSNPLEFVEPLFTSPLDNDDKKMILMGLGITQDKIDSARSLQELFVTSLSARKNDYDAMKEEYLKDSEKRSLFASSVAIACDDLFSEIETEATSKVLLRDEVSKLGTQ